MTNLPTPRDDREAFIPAVREATILPLFATPRPARVDIAAGMDRSIRVQQIIARAFGEIQDLFQDDPCPVAGCGAPRDGWDLARREAHARSHGWRRWLW